MADDEHDEEEGPFGGAIPIGHVFAGLMPPEVREAMANAQAQAEMMQEASVHGHINLLDTLNEEALTYFRSVMGHVADHGDQSSDQAASWHAGFYAALLWKRFNICPACGVNHDKEAHDMAAEQQCPSCGSPIPEDVGMLTPEEVCTDAWHHPKS